MLPGLQTLGVIAPGHAVERALEIGPVHAGIVEEQVVAELAPADLPEKSKCAAVGLGRTERGRDLPGADLAEMQMRRKPARALPRRELAAFRIA